MEIALKFALLVIAYIAVNIGFCYFWKLVFDWLERK
jgi:hypothetical protein